MTQARMVTLPFEVCEGGEYHVSVPDGHTLVQVIPEGGGGNTVLCVLIPAEAGISRNAALTAVLMWESEAADIDGSQNGPAGSALDRQTARTLLMCAGQIRDLAGLPPAEPPT